jgi:hypothetical protein
MAALLKLGHSSSVVILHLPVAQFSYWETNLAAIGWYDMFVGLLGMFLY